MHLNPSASQSQTKHAHVEASRRLGIVGYGLHLGGKGEGGRGAGMFLYGVGLHKCTYKSVIILAYLAVRNVYLVTGVDETALRLRRNYGINCLAATTVFSLTICLIILNFHFSVICIYLYIYCRQKNYST